MNYFNFWSKFLSFKGVSPWNEWWSRKFFEFSSFIVWLKEVLTKHPHYRHWSIFGVFMNYFNFWSKFLSFKGVSTWNEWRSKRKIKYFQVSLYDEGMICLNILIIDIGPFFECLWNISIFCRNSWVSKVLAHEMSDEVESCLNFQVSLYD